MNIADLTLELIANTAYREIVERLYYQTARFLMQSLDTIDLSDEIAVFHQEVKDLILALEANNLDAFGSMRRNHVSQSFLRMSLAKKA